MSFNDDLQNFLNAIGIQESGGDYNSPAHMDNGYWNMGGKYQILAENWPTWAQEAGLSPNAEYSPANQDTVAAYKIQQLFNEYGDWSQVAAAWNGGAGGAASYAANGANSYEANYVQSVLSKLNSPLTSSASSTSFNTSNSSGIMTTISNIGSKVIYTAVGLVLFIGGIFLLFKDNTTVLKEGKNG